MSQPVAYTPPEYVPPEISATQWSGPERRSSDPVNQLGRSLNRLCLEASDPYEIVAHLEALGLSPAVVRLRYGAANHFELAQALYRRTPRIRDRRPNQPGKANDWASPLAIGLAFVTTFFMGAFSQAGMLIPAIVVLVWSQVAASLLSRAQGELSPSEQQQVRSLVVQLGAVGIVVSWLSLDIGFAALTPTLVWFAVGALLWSKQWVAALAIPALLGVCLLVTWLLPVPPRMPVYLVGITTIVAILSLMAADTRGALRWLRRSAAVVVHPLLYGLGQGLLIFALLTSDGEANDPVPGAVLLLLILVFSQPLLVLLKDALAQRLWRATDEDSFKQFAHLALVLYVAAYLTPLVGALAFESIAGIGSWHFHWFAFGLFGLNLGISVVDFALGNPAGASIPFLLAGMAAALGAPFIWVCVLLAAVLLLLVQVGLRQVGRYAVHLL